MSRIFFKPYQTRKKKPKKKIKNWSLAFLKREKKITDLLKKLKII